MHIDELNMSLIVRFLLKEADEEEKRKLFKWVYQNNQNEKLFYYLKDIWQTTHYQKVANSANTNAEWQKFAKVAIQKESKIFSEKTALVRKLYRVIKIAAMVVLVFSVGFFVQYLMPEKQEYSIINVPYGAKSELDLPDGSKVWVNSGSVLKYPSSLTAKEVNLYLEGEAFFKIAENKKRTLNVNTSTLTIQVHGTSFNVKSYPDEEIVETTLLEGSIAISGKVGNRVLKTPIFLKPNEQATLIKGKNEIQFKDSNSANDQISDSSNEQNFAYKPLIKTKPQLQIKQRIELEPLISWKNNVLNFKNERFEDLSRKIERWYNVEIEINDADLKNSRYTGTFENETIEQALEALCLSLPFKYEIEKNQINIFKKNSN